MERNSSRNPLWLKCLSFAHFTRICSHVNPLLRQLSEPGLCNCKNSRLERPQIHGEFPLRVREVSRVTGRFGRLAEGSLVHLLVLLPSSTTESRWLGEWQHCGRKMRQGPGIPMRSQSPRSLICGGSKHCSDVCQLLSRPSLPG